MTHRVVWMLALVCMVAFSSPCPANEAKPQPSSDVGKLNMKSGFVFEKPPFKESHASTLVEAEPGTLLAACFGGTREGNPDVKIWLSRGAVAADGTTQWAAPVVAAQASRVPCWNPVLFKTRAAELLLFYKAGKSPQEWSGFLKRSSDGGRTWSKAEILPAGILGPIRSKPIETDDGRIICGSSVESFQAWTCWMDITPDAGRTWTKHGPITVPGISRAIIQPTVFETSDHRLRCLCRAWHSIGKICASTSSDGGLTWSPAKPIDLPNPNSGIDAVRLADGRIVLVYNHSKAKPPAPLLTVRWPLNVAVSEDGGETFRPAFELESEPPGPYSYPAVIQTGDGRVHVTYTWERKRIKHVSFDPSGL